MKRALMVCAAGLAVMTYAGMARAAPPMTLVDATSNARDAGPTTTTPPTITGGAPATGGRRGTCRGEPAEIIDVDWWNGTDRRDVVIASAEVVDKVYAAGGDDLICLFDPGDHYGRVSVYAGWGNDTVVTYNGSHEIYGEDGDDIVYLNGAGEYVDGGSGSDHVWGLGGSAGHYLYGGSGTDVLQGSPDGDHLYGDDAADLLIGAGGDDHLFGGSGDDNLLGGAGADSLDGEANHDTCSDGAGTTFLDCEVVVNAPPFPEGT